MLHPSRHCVENPFGELPRWFYMAHLNKVGRVNVAGKLDGYSPRSLIWCINSFSNFCMSTSGGTWTLSSQKVDKIIKHPDEGHLYSNNQFHNLQNSNRIKPIWIDTSIQIFHNDQLSEIGGCFDFCNKDANKALTDVIRELAGSTSQYIINFKKHGP